MSIKKHQVDASEIFTTDADQIHQLAEEASPNDADVVLAETSEGDAWSKIRIPVSALGGGGGGPNLVFNDDHEFTETATTYQSKHSFRIVKDSNNPPTSWRVVCSLWVTGGGGDTASLQVDIGGDTVEITATETSETIKSGNITITAADDTLLTGIISLKVVGAHGDTAHVKYIDLYAVY